MPGNKANFNEMDILRVFIAIDKTTGRRELAKELYLGEGTLRNILDILKDKRLVNAAKKGHIYSAKGKRLLSALNKKIEFPKRVFLKKFEKYKSIGIKIKNLKNYAPSYQERDSAVKNGADGALIFKDKFELFGNKFSEMEKYFKIEKNSAVVVCYSNDYRISENACLAIAKELKSIAL